MRILCTFLTFGCFFLTTSAEDVPDNALTRKMRQSFLNIVRFPNYPCNGTSDTEVGTCYTSDECTERNGRNVGTCADGYGVCCQFTATCGQQLSENNTYFASPDDLQTPGSCSLRICRCSTNVCQLRLDFNTFEITGPSTSTDSFAQFALAGNAPITTASQCLDDQFQVTNPDGSGVGNLCGILTGEHLYIDAARQCNDLIFNFGAIDSTREWNIQITQYSCDYINRAPPGCDQWFFGEDEGTIQSFNYNDGMGIHLAEQDQTICIRRESDTCGVCFVPQAETDIQLSGAASEAKFGLTGSCCGYGAGVTNFDCLLIPDALTTKLTNTVANGGFCGSKKGLVAPDTTVCTTQEPFSLRFVSDLFEFDGESKRSQTGFRLNYVLQDC